MWKQRRASVTRAANLRSNGQRSRSLGIKMWKSFSVYTLVKIGSVYVHPRPKWPPAHSTHIVEWFHQRKSFVFVIFVRNSYRIVRWQVCSVVIACATSSPADDDAAVGISLSQFIPASQPDPAQQQQQQDVSDVRLEYVVIRLLDREHRLYGWTRYVYVVSANQSITQ